MVGGKCSKNAPWGLRWRSSVEFVTIVAMFGFLTDQLTYSLIIPVIPYQLEAFGYDGIGAKISWLLVAFSGTLVLATPPIAHYSEVYRNRKIPLLIGLAALIGSQVMFMEAPAYWVMILARSLQGVSSAVIWSVGLALLCDTAPEQSLGRQFGVASAGFTIGGLVGPPVAGALFQNWGFRAPFILGIVITVIDLLARLLLIERHEAIKWGVDPMGIAFSDDVWDPEAASEIAASERTGKPPITESQSTPQGRSSDTLVSEGESGIAVDIEGEVRGCGEMKKKLPESKPRVDLLPHIVLFKLMKSPRAGVCILVSLIRGLVWTVQETTVVLHMSNVWGLDAREASVAFVVATVPTVFSGALSGWLGDRYGPALIGCATLLLSLPWFGLITIEGPLAMFLAFLGLEAFFASGLFPILTLELSSASRSMESVGYAHVYGAFILAYGIGTIAGPIVAGQMYDHLDRGWFAIAFTGMGFMSGGLALAFFMLGERPLGLRLFRNKGRTTGEKTSEVQTSEEVYPGRRSNHGHYHINLSSSSKG